MPWAIPPSSTRLFWLDRRSLGTTIAGTRDGGSWDTANTDMRASIHHDVKEGQQKIIHQVPTNPCGRGHLAVANVMEEQSSASCLLSGIDIGIAIDIGIDSPRAVVSVADMVDVRESPEPQSPASLSLSSLSLSSSGQQELVSVASSRVSFSEMVNVRKIPKTTRWASEKRACFYSAKDIAIFELQAFLQDLDMTIDSSGFPGHQVLDEHKDDCEEPRMTGAISDDVRCCIPHDYSVLKAKRRATSSPSVSPNPRIVISSPRSSSKQQQQQQQATNGSKRRRVRQQQHNKRVTTTTKQANGVVSDKLRQMFVPFGPSDFAKEIESTVEVIKDDDEEDVIIKSQQQQQQQGRLMSCFATSASKKKSSTTKKLLCVRSSCLVTSSSSPKKKKPTSENNRSKEVSFSHVNFRNAVQVLSIPEIRQCDKERLFYSYDDFASFEMEALMEQQQQQQQQQQQGDNTSSSKVPIPSSDQAHRQQPCMITPRVSFCQDDPQIILIPKLRHAELGTYFYRNGDIAQFRHDAWMEERLVGHLPLSFGCDTKG